MQAITYFRDGQPLITWPMYQDVMDDNGNPTGEQTSNIDVVIAMLPPGTEYTLMGEAEAIAWQEANKLPPSPEERKAEIFARLAEIDAASARPARTLALGTASDADRKRLAELENEATSLRSELVNG